MILYFFKLQLFDQESWTYTYLLGCLVKKEAVLVDPVDKQVNLAWFTWCFMKRNEHIHYQLYTSFY